MGGLAIAADAAYSSVARIRGVAPVAASLPWAPARGSSPDLGSRRTASSDLRDSRGVAAYVP